MALNCVVNGALVQKNFNNLWIQPASGDSGGAIGAALACHYIFQNKKRIVQRGVDKMKGSFDSSFTDEEILKSLLKKNAVFKKLSENEMIERTCEALISSKAIGWMQEEWNLDQGH